MFVCEIPNANALIIIKNSRANVWVVILALLRSVLRLRALQTAREVQAKVRAWRLAVQVEQWEA